MDQDLGSRPTRRFAFAFAFSVGVYVLGAYYDGLGVEGLRGGIGIVVRMRMREGLLGRGGWHVR
jgi:hypothetical protein